MSGSTSAGPSATRSSRSRRGRASTKSSQDAAPKSSSDASDAPLESVSVCAQNLANVFLCSAGIVLTTSWHFPSLRPQKSSTELNAMLITNLQRKDSVNEQLIQLMEGTAPPGTDAEWLRTSK